MTTKKNKAVVKPDYFYLFTGYVKYKDGKPVLVKYKNGKPVPDKNGKPLPVDRKVDTLRDTVVFTNEENPEDGKVKLVPWTTNVNGVFHKINDVNHTFGDRATALHNIDNKDRKFLIPPKELLGLSFATKGSDWSVFLSDNVDIKSGLPLQKLIVKKSHLRKPLDIPAKEQADKTASDISEENYKTWYEKVGDNEMLPGFFIEKTRAVLFIFSNEAFIGSMLDIWAPGKDITKDEPLNIGLRREIAESINLKKPHLVLRLPPDQLKPGIYTIKVTLPDLFEGEANLSKNITDPNFGSSSPDKSYTFSYKLNFNLTNFAGEYDVVMCDPITVEEAFLTQFSADYSHIVAAALEHGYGSDLKMLEDNAKKAEWVATKSPALKSVSDQIAFGIGKVQFANQLRSASGGGEISKIIGKAVYDSFVAENGGTENDALKFVIGSSSLGFGIKSAKNQWTSLTKLLAKEYYENAAYLLLKTESNVQRLFGSSRLINPLKRAITNGKTKVFELAVEKIVEDAGFGPKTAMSTKVIAWIDAILSSYSAVNSGIKYYEGTKKVDEAQKDVKKLLTEYDDKFKGIPNREGIGTIEKYRKKSVLEETNADKKLREMCDQMADATVGALCLTPAVVPATIFAVVKSTLGLATTALEFAYKTFFEEEYSNRKSIAALSDNSVANQSLMPTKKDKNSETERLETQFRLRSEAINGMFGILLRAGLTTDDEGKYLKKLKDDYQLETYIRLFVLNDQWQFPVKPLVPISLDEYWHYAINPRGKFVIESALGLDGYKGNYGFEKPLSVESIKQYLTKKNMFILGILDKVLEDNHKADFQKNFPIHNLESKNINDFALAFRTSYKHIGEDSLEYTCVYKRDKKLSGDEWKPIIDDGIKGLDNLEAISPFSGIRILVVLKKYSDGKKENEPHEEKDKIDGLYPISLQLHRTDIWLAQGPVYKKIAKELMAEDLLTDEQDWVGRIGCVFYPMFSYNVAVFPGTKPMAGWFFNRMNDNEKHFSDGYLADMRYSYELRVGDHKVSSEIKFGGNKIDGKVANTEDDFTEYKVTVDIDDPEELRLTNFDFLKSRHTAPVERPQLFSRNSGTGGCLVKLGSGDYKFPDINTGKFIAPDDYNWESDSVDIIMLFWADELLTDEYEKVKRQWRDIPVGIELFNDGFLWNDAKGPMYQSNACYLGKFQTDTLSYAPYTDKKNRAAMSPGFQLDTEVKNVIKKHPELQPVIDIINNRSVKIPSQYSSPNTQGYVQNYKDLFFSMYVSGFEQPWEYAHHHLDFANQPKEEFSLPVKHLYAAQFNLGHTPPALVNGKQKKYDSIRPFASKEIYSEVGEKKYYEYTITNIHMPKAMGFSSDSPVKNLYDGRDSWNGSGRNQEIKLCFPAPTKKTGFEHLKKVHKMDNGAIKKWITEDTTMRNPTQVTLGEK